jgi:hypothetical protein
MKNKLLIGTVLFILLLILLSYQLYKNIQIQNIKGEIVSIENDSYNLSIEIKSNNMNKTFIINDNTLIYKNDNTQSNFNSLKINENVQIEYKPLLFEKNKANTVKIIN